MLIERVIHELRQAGGADPEAATQAVFEVVSRDVDAGQVRHAREMLPEDLQTLWPEASSA